MASRREETRTFHSLASQRVEELWSSLRDVAAEHVAGIEKLSTSYLGDRRGIEAITRAELASRLRRRNVVVLDVRPTAEHVAGHIPGARSVPPDQVRQHLRAIPKDSDIVVYCRGPFCVYADDVVRSLQRRGIRARRLEDGFPEWNVPATRSRSANEEGPDGTHRFDKLREKIKVMYRAVAEAPQGEFHFEWDVRGGTARLPVRRARRRTARGDRVVRRCRLPPRHGRHRVRRTSRRSRQRFRHGCIPRGPLAGTAGEVVGIDMTEEQLTKARRLAERDGHINARFEKGYIDAAPIADGSVDVVISNGVINLCDDKKAVFCEIARMLKPTGGWPSPTSSRNTNSSKRSCTTSTCGPRASVARCNKTSIDRDRGSRPRSQRRRGERRLSVHLDSVWGAAKTFGVKSMSVLATKPAQPRRGPPSRFPTPGPA